MPSNEVQQKQEVRHDTNSTQKTQMLPCVARHKRDTSDKSNKLI
jgi:hypothetical protein